MSRNIAFQSLLTVALCFAITCAHGTNNTIAQTNTKPNIVVLLVDDHARTPAIDSLADHGMRFDNFICANSICSPSRASILTGQYSHKNGVLGLIGSINDASPQYPVELLNAGYQTWLVGKWHLKSQPKGYEKFASSQPCRPIRAI